MVKIRLARMGRKKVPVYRIIAADSRMPRDGRFLEKLGTYDPVKKMVKIDTERYSYWKGVGAQETKTVARIYKNYKAESSK